MTPRRAVAATALLVAAACAPTSPDAEVAVGGPLPPFELPSLHGGTVTSAELVGELPVLINFWATWCDPCVYEIPALNQLHASGRVRVVSISVDRADDDDVVRDFVRRHEIDYEVLRGDLGTLTRYGSQSIPYTLVLDSRLNVRSLHRVAVSRSTLERDVGAAR